MFDFLDKKPQRGKNIRIVWYVTTINLLIFFMLLLFFEPTAKSDDYDMANLLYGGFNGEYSPFILYINILMGQFMKLLLSIWPNVSWYYILQFLFMIVAFSTITYVLVIRGVWNNFKIFCYLILVFSGYEFYIRITFTKTAGLTIIAGLVLLLDLIEEQKDNIGLYCFAVIQIIVGTMFRNSVFFMLLGVSFSCFIIYILENRRNMYVTVKGIIRFFIIVLILFVAAIFLKKYNDYCFKNNVIWKEYISYNAVRSNLQDFSWWSGAEFLDEYKKLGVSENDVIMWNDLGNISDPQIFTTNLMEEISEINTQFSSIQSTNKFLDATKNLFKYFIGNSVFYMFFSCVVLVLYSQRKETKWKTLLISAFIILFYYYFYFQGRLQHHVDASLFFMGVVLLLYYSTDKINQEDRIKLYIPIVIVLINGILSFYSEIISSSYYGKTYGQIDSQYEQYQNNYERLKQISQDKEHLYLMGAQETNTYYPCFNVFEVIDKNFYSNIYRLNQYTFVIPRTCLKEYNIDNDNPFSVITDNEKIVYCVSEERIDDIEVVEKYIREHYNKNSTAVWIDEINGLHLFKFISKDLIDAQIKE